MECILTGVSPQTTVKTPKFNILSSKSVQKEEVSFDQWVFEVRSVLKKHSEATLWEGIICSLHGVMADLV